MAVDNVKNDAVKSFIANLPLMKPVVINSVKAEIDEQWANYKDPLVMNNLLNVIAENNPFFGMNAQTSLWILVIRVQLDLLMKLTWRCWLHLCW